MYLSKIDYFIVCLAFNFNTLYIIWTSGDLDCVVLDEEKKIIAFNIEADLLRYTEEKGIIIKPDTTKIEVSKIQQWVLQPNYKVDFTEFLNFWNLCIDIAESTGIQFSGDIKNDLRNRVYDELFDGNGLFIVDDPNPVLDDDEINELSEIMQNGLKLVIDNISVSS